MAIKQLSDGGTEGTVLGQSSSDLVGFYGTATPVDQPVITLVGTATATTALNETMISRIIAALVDVNLVRTT